MDWTTEQQALRRYWDLERLEADPANLQTVDPMDAFLRDRDDVRETPKLAHPADVDESAR